MINITLALSLCIIYTDTQTHTDTLMINITLVLTLCVIYTDTHRHIQTLW